MSDQVDRLIIDLSVRDRNIDKSMSTLEQRINHHQVELDQASEVVRSLLFFLRRSGLTSFLTDPFLLQEDCVVGGPGCEPPRSRLQVS